MTTKQRISAVCDSLRSFLHAKNDSYGDSAINPSRIMSRASAEEQLLVRIDDKLNRLRQGNALPTESLDDTIKDLAGYLVLLMVVRGIGCDTGHAAPSEPDELTQLRAYVELLEADRDNVVRVNVEMAAMLGAFMDAPTPGSACKQQTSAPLVRCQEVV